MSAICDLALALGMTLSGACQPATATPEPMPPNEPGAWAVKAEAPPPAPAPAPAPAMPPVIIEKTIIKEVPASAPPAPVATAPEPDPYADAVQASYRRRSANRAGWSEVALPVSMPQIGTSATAAQPHITAPAMPLDLAATVKVPGGAEYEEKAVTSTRPVDNSRMLTTDRIITGIVENGTNSQLDGTVGGTTVIQVSRDVFGYHGRNILIPKGSRLVCGYKSLEKVGATRSQWRCSRLLAGGSRFEIFNMRSNVFDVQGHLGASGEVDNRIWETYGTATILAGISAAVRMATAQAGTATSSSSSSASGSSSSYSDGGALSQGGQELSQRFGEIGAAALERTINLVPILKTFQGQRVVIRPDADWYISKVVE
ncbi:MAG: TrbI/VirB10 family protein [Rhodospirillaceae bacterium]|nr:TrbI/VirB10 family protein [Rhodospirillales bacterium]